MHRIATRLLTLCLSLSGITLVGLLGLLFTLGVHAAPTAEITVTTAADTVANDGECSLREAIQSANGDSAVGGCETGSGNDIILFAIPGTGPHVIQLQSSLPAIAEPVTIDGYSQADATPNTHPGPQGLDTVLQIVLDGSALEMPVIPDGLVITGGGSTVRGLAIQNFAVGIALQTNGNNIIAGNFVGTNVSGTVAAESSGVGILVESSGNTIGYGFTISATERNLISGNRIHGVILTGAGANFNNVNGNLIGTGISARNAISNGVNGVRIVDSAANNSLTGNVIAGNGGFGIRIENGAAETTIADNFIGTNGEDDRLGNGEGGILARNSGPQTIGGLYTAEGCCRGNTIAYNAGNGVTVRADISISQEKGIRGNRIYSNTDLGIDLAGDGVTLNDPGDADGENDANHLQNFPVLTAARVVTTDITITGTLNTITNTAYQIDFFASDACDPSGYGEGQRYLGAASVTTDESGNATFTVTLTGTVPSLAGGGDQITATATDPDGNTSEFSLCVEAIGDAEATPQEFLFMPSLWGEDDEG